MESKKNKVASGGSLVLFHVGVASLFFVVAVFDLIVFYQLIVNSFFQRV